MYVVEREHYGMSNQYLWNVKKKPSGAITGLERLRRFEAGCSPVWEEVAEEWLYEKKWTEELLAKQRTELTWEERFLELLRCTMQEQVKGESSVVDAFSKARQQLRQEQRSKKSMLQKKEQRKQSLHMSMMQFAREYDKDKRSAASEAQHSEQKRSEAQRRQKKAAKRARQRAKKQKRKRQTHTIQKR